jgi:hypothetical protein
MTLALGDWLWVKLYRSLDQIRFLKEGVHTIQNDSTEKRQNT